MSRHFEACWRLAEEVAASAPPLPKPFSFHRAALWGPWHSNQVLQVLQVHAHLAHTPDTSRRTPHITYRSTERALDACTIARPSYYTYPRAQRKQPLSVSLSQVLSVAQLSRSQRYRSARALRTRVARVRPQRPKYPTQLSQRGASCRTDSHRGAILAAALAAPPAVAALVCVCGTRGRSAPPSRRSPQLCS